MGAIHIYTSQRGDTSEYTGLINSVKDKANRQDRDWEKTFIKQVSDKGLKFTVYEEDLHLDDKDAQYSVLKDKRLGTSLVVQWLRTHLQMQGTRV